jgi:NAD(P)-dependent dehydrogenase (short-subunit alcohol dehydrogenase family)
MIRGRRGASGFGYASTAEEVTNGVDLRGKTVLVTGVTSGLGLESARVLALRGARIFGLARDRDKAAEALRPFGAGHLPFACELSEPASVRACADAVAAADSTVDVLLLNAGIMALPQRTLKHGHELQFLTNHVGHFILTTRLLPRLADGGRVVVLSSAAHKYTPPGGIAFADLTLADGYRDWTAYGQSKLANLLFARGLAKRLEGTGKTANAVHPGVIPTNLSRHMSPVARALQPIAVALAMKTVPQGAATQCWAAAHPAAGAINGAYLADCNVAESSAHGRDLAMAERLWTVTEEIVAKL